MRRKVSRKSSSRLFKRTATRTRKLNLNDAPVRGGIRLW